MKTTDKYAARLRRNGNSYVPEQREGNQQVYAVPAAYPREIILMRIHQILKSARNILDS